MSVGKKGEREREREGGREREKEKRERERGGNRVRGSEDIGEKKEKGGEKNGQE